VNVEFSPKAAGLRLGAVVLTGSAGNVLATGYLQGIGKGPQIAFLPQTPSVIASGFSLPTGVAVDENGDIYVADSLNGNLDKVTPPGSGYPPIIDYFVNQVGPVAGVAVDGAGNTFTAQTGAYDCCPSIIGNAFLPLVAQTPAAYTLEQIGYGFVNAWGVAVDGSGNLYVADYGTGPYGNANGQVLNGQVYKETLSAGEYTQSTIGSGWIEPVGVAVDSSGNVYVADAGVAGMAGFVVKETLQTDGSFIPAQIGSGWITPTGVLLDASGSLYIADSDGEIGLNGFVTRETPQADGSYTQSTLISSSIIPTPEAITMDDGGNLYIPDGSGNNFLKENLYKINYATPPSFNFASTNQGQISADSPRTVTVENIGNSPMTISAISYPTDFHKASGVTTDCVPGKSLAAGNTCTLSIDFSPVTPLGGNSSQVLSENVTITTNSLNKTATLQTIPVSGTELPELPAATPAFSPLAGTYSEAQSVAISDATADAVIYYTTDGVTIPTTNSTKYTGAITVKATETLQAIAVATEHLTSDIASATYIILQSQTITFPAIAEPVGAESTVTLTATATSGLPVSFASTTPTICNVSQSGSAWSAHLEAFGICTIIANQPGNGIWAKAPNVAQNFTVHKNAQTITFPAIVEPVYIGGTLQPTATSSSGLPVSYVSVHPTICTVTESAEVWTINLIAVGECSIHAEQGGNSVYAAAAVNQNFYVHAKQ